MLDFLCAYCPSSINNLMASLCPQGSNLSVFCPAVHAMHARQQEEDDATYMLMLSSTNPHYASSKYVIPHHPIHEKKVSFEEHYPIF